MEYAPPLRVVDEEISLLTQPRDVGVRYVATSTHQCLQGREEVPNRIRKGFHTMYRSLFTQ